MRYLLVIDQIGSGGAEKILLEYKQYLENQGDQVSVFALYGKQQTGGVEYGFIGPNASNSIKKLLQQRAISKKLKAYEKDVSPDRIFSFLERSNSIVAGLTTKAQKVLSVHNVLSIQYNKIGNPILRNLAKSVIKKTYNNALVKVLAVSKQVKEDLTDNFGVLPRQITVINNRVDKSKIIELSKEAVMEYNFEQGCKYLLNIGRFTLQKAQWKLIKAMTLVDAKLILLGEGEYKERLEELIAKLNLENKVTILPFNPNPYKFMAHSNMIVMPSLYEGLSIAIAESIALGKNFVGSKKAIPEDIFEDLGFYNSITYTNTSLEADFSTAIEDDDRTLAELITQNINNNISTNYSSWNSTNSKTQQFNDYCKLYR